MSGRALSRSAAWPIALLLVLWGVAFSMACSLAGRSPAGTAEDGSVMGRFLGASRAAFSQSFYTEADNYFHKGVGHIAPKAFSNSVFQSWRAGIRPSGHDHTTGVGAKEIMPWLRFATAADPQNMEAYLTTAFWLSRGIQRPDIAEQVLVEAQQNNPGDYRPLHERARLLIRQGRDAEAASLLDAGIRFWPSRLPPTNEEARIEMASMLSYRAFLFELQGDRADSLQYFKAAAGFFPQNRALLRRVEALERGDDTSGQDRATWDNLFPTRTVCGREDHDHAEDHDGHGHEE